MSDSDNDRQMFDDQVTAQLNWQEHLAEDVEHDKWLSELERDNRAFQEMNDG